MVRTYVHKDVGIATASILYETNAGAGRIASRFRRQQRSAERVASGLAASNSVKTWRRTIT